MNRYNNTHSYNVKLIHVIKFLASLKKKKPNLEELTSKETSLKYIYTLTKFVQTFTMYENPMSPRPLCRLLSFLYTFCGASSFKMGLKIEGTYKTNSVKSTL